MDLLENPFSILGASPRDGRHRLAELAEECSLLRDPQECARARSILMNPRQRLSAEMSWLPGVGPKRVDEILLFLEKGENETDSFQEISRTLPPLAKANVLAAAASRLALTSAEKTSAWILELGEAVEEIAPESLVEVINSERVASGFPEVNDIATVEKEIKQRRRFYRQVMESIVDTLRDTESVRAVTMAVERATDNGKKHGPILIDDLVDSYYEVKHQDFLRGETGEIELLVGELRDRASEDCTESDLSPIVDKLIQSVEEWDLVAQPIQVSTMSRGLRHEASVNLAMLVRGVAIDLCNEHGMLDLSQQLIAMLRRVFAEVVDVADRTADDAEALDGLVEQGKTLGRFADEIESLPDDDAHGGGFLKALVALHVQMMLEPTNPALREQWLDAVRILLKIKPDILRRWVKALEEGSPSFVDANSDLVELLTEHADRVTQAEKACNDPQLPRAVKAIAAVCQAIMLDVEKQETDDIDAFIGQSISIVAACGRQAFLKGLERVKTVYPSLYGFNPEMWDGASEFAGSQVHINPAKTRWASELGAGAPDQESGGGKFCLGCLIGLFVLWLISGGGFLSSRSPRNAAPPMRTTASPADTAPTSEAAEREERQQRLEAELSTLSDDLERLDQEIGTERSELEALATELEAEMESLQRRGTTVNEYDQEEVDDYNAAVNALRSRVERAEIQQEDFNKKVEEYNRKLERARAVVKALEELGVRE